MRVISGPPRYFFLRRARGAHEETANWPPDVKPMAAPDNQVGVVVRIYPEEIGWRAELVTNEADQRTSGDGAFLLSRDTTLGLAPEGRSGASGVALGLLGVRVVNAESKGVEYVTHLIVRVTGGMSFGSPTTPFVAPIDMLLLSEYVERGAEQGARARASLDLRLTPEQLVSLPRYLPDEVIARYVTHTLDRAVLEPQARHTITFEVEAGRVSLYGRPELISIGEELREALEHTAGVVDIADHMLYGAELDRQVEEALAKAGLNDVSVLYEHGLIDLRGTVPDNASRHKARDVAMRIPGVRGVVNDLRVVTAPAEEPLAATDNAVTTESSKNQASESIVPSEQTTEAAAASADGKADGATSEKQTDSKALAQ
ncbi:MAG TPA: BON domain-containing protein [Ktedonobacterales bacterium]|nr:BON domain-containing protein [Ktedonobacterales bacterium]